jgi:hypothetical protein
MKFIDRPPDQDVTINRETWSFIVTIFHPPEDESSPPVGREPTPPEDREGEGRARG